jgi:hypothetical protein
VNQRAAVFTVARCHARITKAKTRLVYPIDPPVDLQRYHDQVAELEARNYIAGAYSIHWRADAARVAREGVQC